MALEDLTGSNKYISDLVATNPLGTDSKDEGDNHLRGIKNVLKNTLPNVNGIVSASDEELSYSAGLTSAIQTQMDALSALIAANTAAINNINIPVAIPTGSIVLMPINTIPADYLACNGSTISRITYAALFAIIGTTYGAGDGSTNFALPDLRGEFIRGWDNGRGVDFGRLIGTGQTDEFKAHTHAYHSGVGSGSNPIGDADGNAANYNHVTDSAGGTETRPRNVAMIYMIKT